MRNTTVTYQQEQNSDAQQLISNDSLAVNKSLRTPIQEVTVKQPKYLQLEQKAKSKKINYRTWSSEDSVYFNLKTGESSGKLHIIPHLMDEQHEINPTSLSDEVVEKVMEQKAVTAQFDTVASVPPPPVIVRKGSPFEHSKEWLAGFILLALIIAGVVKLTAGKYLSDLFSSIRYQQSATKLFFSGNLQNQKPSLALTFLFFLSTSMLIFEFTHLGGKIPERLSPFVFFLLVNLGVIGYFFIKNILYRFTAVVFDAQQSTKEYLFNANMLSKVFGISCLPIVCVVPFVDVLTATFLLKAGLVLFFIMYIIQLLRGAKIILRSPLSIFYMFLYFCALEILPLSILIKVMIY